MEHLARAALVLLAGCWTAAGARTAEPAPESTAAGPDLEILLERTACFGRCPVFELAIRSDGRVDWTGEEHVAAIGRRTGRIRRDALESLDHEVALVRFFERDRYGKLPREPVCVTQGNTRSCTFTSETICGDTSRTILTVRRGARSHRIDVAHCSDDDPALDELEARIIARSGAAAWIGRGR
jgi:hypothetical protein